MGSHHTSIKWQRDGQDFNYETYHRDFTIQFGGGKVIQGSNPKEYFGNPELPNSEELLMSALAGCYMQTFLAIASKQGYIIDTYSDEASGVSTKNEQGKVRIAEITLHPKIKFSGSKIPDESAINKIRDKAHEYCFIANSLNSQITIEVAVE